MDEWHPSEADNGSDCDGRSVASNEHSHGPVQQKMKRRGKRSTAQRGPTALPKNRGTGFEEFFADPPMTPEEANLEQTEIYCPTLPFEEYLPFSRPDTLTRAAGSHSIRRIQCCIQRFRARRRLNPTQTQLFNEYLFLGGVDTEPNAFGGGHDQKDLKALTPAERRHATATDAVHLGSSADDRYYTGIGHHWTVDFTAVASAFFSTSPEHITKGNCAGVDDAACVVENFLRYVLHHDVCPEYETDVKRAVQMCSMAREEAPLLKNLMHSLPGVFNLAAADLFSPLNPQEWASFHYPRPVGFDASIVFYSTCALLGLGDVLSAARCGGPKAVATYACAVEVIAVERAPPALADRCRRLHAGDGSCRISPVGKVLCKPSKMEDGWVTPSQHAPVADAELAFFFEDAIVANMKPGMTLALEFVQLDVGIRFVRSFSNVVPTFYTFLPQALMKHYKMPRENERPAPSAIHPQADGHQDERDAEDEDETRDENGADGQRGL
ncbi:hypothetical protein RJ55_04061 [Drechmeria coniospora]|nr:hypothetical protein RJ55_04061 [Drechmeria coniospora]